MVALKGIRLYFVIIGVFEVLLSVVFVVCTHVVLQKYSEPGIHWYSLFYVYVSSTCLSINDCMFFLLSNNVCKIFGDSDLTCEHDSCCRKRQYSNFIRLQE